MIDTLIQVVKELGFPIAVCAYTLYTQNTTLKSLNDTIQSNTRMTQRLIVELGETDIIEDED